MNDAIFLSFLRSNYINTLSKPNSDNDIELGSKTHFILVSLDPKYL